MTPKRNFNLKSFIQHAVIVLVIGAVVLYQSEKNGLQYQHNASLTSWAHVESVVLNRFDIIISLSRELSSTPTNFLRSKRQFRNSNSEIEKTTLIKQHFKQTTSLIEKLSKSKNNNIKLGLEQLTLLDKKLAIERKLYNENATLFNNNLSSSWLKGHLKNLHELPVLPELSLRNKKG